MRASESPFVPFKSKQILFFCQLICSSVSGAKTLKKKGLRFAIFNCSEKLQNIFEIGLKKCGVITQKPLSETTSFPGFFLFLPRERTLVAAGHVTAHDKLLPSQGTLALLFYSQEPIRDFQAGAI